MPNWLKNLINWLSTAQIQIPSPPVEEKAIEILPAFTAKTLYVNSEIGLNIRSLPDVTSEKLGTIPHGAEVSVLNEQDKWFEVKTNELQGWVSSVYLTEERPLEQQQPKPKEDISDELPQFRIGVTNNARDPNTLKVRKIINYEFGLNFEEDELQCTEYVQYRTLQAGINITWPVRAGRNGGNWANLFEKHGTYKVLNEPKAGCAMSFTAGFKTPAMNTTGHIAFVEQVLEGGSVKISEANWPPPGKYNERTVPVSEWRDKYKCRFVDFS
jgi:hypothetical protein